MSAMSCSYSSASVFFSLNSLSRRRQPSILSFSISPPAESEQKFSFSALQLWTRNRLPIFTYCSTPSSSTSAFDLSPPPIDQDLLETVTVAGAKLSDDGIVETFNNDDEALEASENGVVVVDLSHYGRIRVSGEDRIQFLHNQSTADFESLHEGQGCDTVFVTPTARTIDLVHAWVMKNAVTLVVSPVTNQSLIQMLGKYIFSADKVEIQDITKQTCLFALVGPKTNQVMEELNLGDLIGQPYGTHSHYTVNGMPITVSVGNPISEEGFSLLTIPGAAESVWKTLLSLGSVPMGTNAFERLRISQGRPEPGKELTNEYNVLEAHLWNAVSLNKGCYKGQETIARLVTYDGIKQRLWGLSLSSPVEPGSAITVDGKKVGKVTSYAKGRKKSEHFGLGYIKRQGASEGDTVVVGDNILATVVEVPFLAKQRHPPPTSKRTTSQ
ncbi:putative transferase At1g60990, chloroplastic [Impatiens glandulifera]|uniref:putative transferase At1g60990, chloroplastic n=1 Tax=Impatiens glandulifera TaxID=253017 RepID=UPI001FB1334D|nr:putative transferase At1g60990, chloroplastic [Impatiens glandulifera]